MNIHVGADERQAQLEIDMAGLGVARYRTRVNKEVSAERGASITPGRYLTQQAVNPLADGISAFIAEVYGGRPGPRAVAAKLTKDMDPYVVAYLTTRAILNALMKRPSVALLTLARNVSRDIEAEARFEHFATLNPRLFKKIDKSLEEDGANEQHKRAVLTYAMGKYDIPWDRWSKTETIHLGIKMVELFCEYTGLAEMIQAVDSDSRDAPADQYRVTLTDKVSDWIKGSLLRGELLSPQYLPTIRPPIPWQGFRGGGYHTQAVRPLPLVRKCRPEQQRLLEGTDLSSVYGGLNAIQNTPWQVNGRVLETMQTLIRGGSGVAGLVPNREEDLPDKPHDIDTNPKALKEWKWQARDVHVRNIQLRRDQLTQQSLIDTAARFVGEPAIYFPHNMDFRGRVYPIPQILNPQGSDPVKALLRFAEGKPLGDDGERWLAIHGANTYGIDKVDFAVRVQWVFDNQRQIIDCARNPIQNLWWTEADKPWCFLAFCFEWAALHDLGAHVFRSHLPIALDGSCNGLQHFSAMLRDSVGGSAVNLLPADKPQDIYQVVADRVMAQLRLIASGKGLDPEKERWAYEWLHFGIDRKITKRPVMVLPYGGTPRSCVKYVEEEVMSRIDKGQAHNFGDELKQAIGFLASLVWSAIGDVVIAAREAMDWLQKVARLVAKENLPMHWTTPSKFVVFQSYMDVSSRQIETKIAGKIFKPREYFETDKINRSKQATSVSPNFVHSLDASAMILTVVALALEGITSFAMIHDSYGTHACDTTRLAYKLREVFISMYKKNPLETLRDELIASGVGIDFPPLPNTGDLDLNLIMQSEFFFA